MKFHPTTLRFHEIVKLYAIVHAKRGPITCSHVGRMAVELQGNWKLGPALWRPLSRSSAASDGARRARRRDHHVRRDATEDGAMALARATKVLPTRNVHMAWMHAHVLYTYG